MVMGFILQPQILLVSTGLIPGISETCLTTESSTVIVEHHGERNKNFDSSRSSGML